MRPVNLKLFAFVIGFAASSAAIAACDVSLASVLPNGQAVLKANCGAGALTDINWKRDGVSISGDIALTPNINGTDIHYTTSLQGGTHHYTATANAGAVVAGTPATITIANPSLTVAATPGGTIASAPAGIAACTSAGGTCSASFAFGTSVALTATPDSGYVFASWGGDCTGTTTTCAAAMTTQRTVTANFGPVPEGGACGPDSNSTPVSSAPTNPGLCATGNATSVSDPTSSPWNYTWGCNGVNGGASTSATACSAPKQVTGACGPLNGGAPQSVTPTNAAQLCSSGNPSSVTATGSPTFDFRWTCNGVNGGLNSAQCAVAQTNTAGVCGSANGGNTPDAPTATACTSGSITNMSTPAPGGDFTWTCSGLGGGANSPTCTAHQTINGACGAAHGQTVPVQPTTNLCVAGAVATAVSGTGPWTWGCNGVNGGTSTSATACSASQGAGSNSDPGQFSGLWMPPTLADGVTANTGTLIVADQSGALGAGGITYTPGCLNQKDYSTLPACKAAGSLTANLYGTSTPFTVTQAQNKIVAIRFKSNATIGTGFYKIYNKDGSSVGKSLTTSLSTVPGDFTNTACTNTSTTTPKVTYGPAYCNVTPNTNYYINIRINEACSGTACNFKLVESAELQ